MHRRKGCEKITCDTKQNKELNINRHETQPIICIGGANVDRKLYVKHEITNGTSNPVKSSKTVGGVARNIAENLGRLSEEVALISVGGHDLDWQEIADVSSPFMNLEHVAQLENASTGSYTAVLDKHGDLAIALADMDVYEEITPALLKEKSDVLKKAKCIVADLNCPGETIEFLAAFTAEQQIPFIIIPVSSPKMDRLPASLDKVDWLIVNKDETETFLNIKIDSERDWKDAVQQWLESGVENVIVTNGEKGVMAGDKSKKIRYYPAVETPNVIDVTGAGDAFCSAVIYAWLQNQAMDDIIKTGLVNSHKTIISTFTVRQELSKAQMKIDMEGIFNEKIC